MIVIKKGFTLIELLAVILILGIIALIAVPSVNKILVESRERAFLVTVRNLSDVVSNQCYTETIRGVEITTYYTIVDGVATPELEIKGDLPDKGHIYVNTDCEVKLEVSNQIKTIKKDFYEKEFTVEEETLTLIAEYVFPNYVAVTTSENNTKVWRETKLNERLNTAVDGTKNEFGYDLSKYEELESFINDSYDINNGQQLNPGDKMRLLNIEEFLVFKNYAVSVDEIDWAYYSNSCSENEIRFGSGIGGWWLMSINSNRTDRFWYVDNNGRQGKASAYCVSSSACNHLKPVVKVKKRNLEAVLFRRGA